MDEGRRAASNMVITSPGDRIRMAREGGDYWWLARVLAPESEAWLPRRWSGVAPTAMTSPPPRTNMPFIRTVMQEQADIS